MPTPVKREVINGVVSIGASRRLQKPFNVEGKNVPILICSGGHGLRGVCANPVLLLNRFPPSIWVLECGCNQDVWRVRFLGALRRTPRIIMYISLSFRP